ncbi:hypothetical protein QN277_009844 [Acacia crassicarpa]|uniref:Uncharacterized protein n=1 Tax=Acacia crassicarpa TaxID=499986 RepID=A0AAE1IQL3_9FABA|nr:hypothetical protein QN277_009844 [Acacia crassicarpa]
MSAISQSRSLNFFVFFLSCSLQFILGFSDDSSGASDAVKPKGKISTVAIIVIVLVVVSLFIFGLFKLWQKKKREEQYARLLKLFEEDDELEVELGLRE